MKTQAEQTRQLWAWSVAGKQVSNKQNSQLLGGEGPRGLHTTAHSTLHQGVPSAPDLQPVQTYITPNIKCSLIYSSWDPAHSFRGGWCFGFFSAEAQKSFTPTEIHLISKSKVKNVSRMGSLKMHTPRISSSMRKMSTWELQSTLEVCNHLYVRKATTRFSQLAGCLYHSTGRRISQKFQLVSSSCPNLQGIWALTHVRHQCAGFFFCSDRKSAKQTLLSHLQTNTD